MAYRKLGRDNKHRRSMLATLTKQEDLPLHFYIMIRKPLIKYLMI